MEASAPTVGISPPGWLATSVRSEAECLGRGYLALAPSSSDTQCQRPHMINGWGGLYRLGEERISQCVLYCMSICGDSGTSEAKANGLGPSKVDGFPLHDSSVLMAMANAGLYIQMSDWFW